MHCRIDMHSSDLKKSCQSARVEYLQMLFPTMEKKDLEAKNSLKVKQQKNTYPLGAQKRKW